MYFVVHPIPVATMKVVHYRDNQRYDPHTDWGVQGHAESRFITLLMYVFLHWRVCYDGTTFFKHKIFT